MPAAARALLWELRRRHQTGIAVLAVYLVIFFAAKLLLGPGYRIRLDPPNGVAAFVTVPATVILFYLIGVFTHGLSGDIATRQSIYPQRMFTLPVTTAALAGWPMLYGTVAAAILWFVVALFFRIVGTDYHLPLVWPSLLFAAYIAWMQALMWMPYGVPGVRVIFAVLALLVIDAVVLVAFNLHASSRLMVAILAPQLPLAYLVAWFALSRARRGDTPDWRPMARPASAANAIVATSHFRSAFRAQLWFEWRRNGRSFPAMVALVLPFELALWFIPGNDNSFVVEAVLIVASLTPPFLALFAATMFAPATPFMLSRPLTNTSMVSAKLLVTIASTLAAWLLVIVMVPAALSLSGTSELVAAPLRRIGEYFGLVHTLTIAALELLALMTITWSNLVQSLIISLTGRPWLSKSAVLAALALMISIPPGAQWLWHRPQLLSAIWNGLPWLVAALVLARLVAAALIAIRIYVGQLVSDQGLIAAALGWSIAVIALYGVLVWLADSPAVPRYFLGAIAVLAVPLVRVSAALPALDWSRHR